MSERKVLTKYYPPDFDPSKIQRSRGSKKEPGQASKLATVRLMAPFSMKCLSCGEFIYKGRKFNARKETTDEKYLAIPIYRFYIRCTRCSAEITFKTDPRRMDYTAEKGAKRNFERWRETDEDGADGADGTGNHLETEEEMLDRLEAEAAEAGTAGAMAALEAKVHDARTEMAVADALDEIRVRNARIQRAEGKEGQERAVEVAELARGEREREDVARRQEEEDAEAARRAFRGRLGDGDVDVLDVLEEEVVGGVGAGDWDQRPGYEPQAELPVSVARDRLAKEANGDGFTKESHGETNMMPPPPPPPPPPTFKKTVKKKKDFSAALGIKKKPSLV